MFLLFAKGGPVMWPLLVASLLGMTVVLERILFIVRQKRSENPELRKKIFFCVEAGDMEQALQKGLDSKDWIVQMLVEGLQHPASLQTTLLSAASDQLKKINRGISVLDTIITLAPLLGLLGTVTGMIGAFGLLGAQELDAPSAITGGIAEALIATAFGLGTAIFCLIPFNGLNSYSENARHEMEQAGSTLEVLIAKLPKAKESFYENTPSLH